MKSEWRTLKLKDAGVSLIDCDHRTPKTTELGYPYITIPQLKDGRVLASEARRISPTDFKEWTKKLMPREHDVIVVRRCNSGESAVVPPGLDCAIGQNLVVLRADGQSVAPQYLRWLVRGPGWWEEVRKFLNVGAVFDSLKCRDIPGFELGIPPLDEQGRIADLLNALDDRIAHNRTLAANLEAIARALFRSWFVDFDPVRAKAAGEAPRGLVPDVAALFPTRFLDNELGEIPEGWKFTPLSAIADFVNGRNFTKDATGTGRMVIRIAELTKGGPTASTVWNDLPNTANDYLANPGDILFAWSGSLGVHVWDRDAGLVNQHIFKVTPREPYGSAFCYFATEELVEDFRAIASGKAVTMGHIKRGDLDTHGTVCPENPAAIAAFEQLVSAVWLRVRTAKREAIILTELRDLLLPRLISGKLCVADAEAALETA